MMERMALHHPGICVVCGDDCRSPTGVCCSRECSYIWNAHRVQRDTASDRYGECANCGAPFLGKRNDRTTCCSRECGFEYQAEGAWREKADALWTLWLSAPTDRPFCIVCFRLKHDRRGNTCSPACGCAAQKAGARDAYVSTAGGGEAECSVCGKGFVQDHGAQVYCSARCSRKAHPSKPRKRAKKYGVHYEPVKPMDVYDRHGWRCGICHQRINRKLQVPHPRAPTLDHIIPMAEGGPHTARNLQPAHFECNYTKGAGSAGSQLRLVA